MPRQGHPEEGIGRALREVKAGETGAAACWGFGIGERTLYVGKERYTEPGLSKLRERRQIREENAKLKRVVADLSGDRHILQKFVARKAEASCRARPGGGGPCRSSGERAPGNEARRVLALNNPGSAAPWSPGGAPPPGAGTCRQPRAVRVPPANGALAAGRLPGERETDLPLYQEEGLIMWTKVRQRATQRQRLTQTPVSAPNQRCAMDFVRQQLADGRWYRVLTEFDQCTPGNASGW